MSTLLHWFTSPEWAQVVKALLHSLWQGALIALVLAIVLRRLGNPVARYRSSLAALMAIVFATVVTWAVINSPSHHPLPPADNPLIAQLPAPDSATIPKPNLNPETVVLTAHKTASTRWTAWLAFAWLAGAILMLARAGFKVTAAEQLRRSCRPLDDSHIETLLAETRRALCIANRICVGVTDKLTSPAVVGIVVPMLILPLALLTTLTPEQIRFVLLHELAHIRRRDYLANLFQFFAESLLFFNPAVWWISHQIRREREACCDALATELSGAPGDYAQTLVHVAEQILYPAPAAAPAFGNKREPSTLTERIQRLLVPGYRPSLGLTWRAMLAALTVSSILLFSSALGTRLTVAAVLTDSRNTNQVASIQPRAGAAADQIATNLQTRVFSVDSNTLYSLAVEDGKPSIADTLVNFRLYVLTPQSKEALAHSNDVPFLTIPAPGMLAGVMLDWPKGVLYNEASGTLTVRATREDLNAIEAILNELSGTPAAQLRAAHQEQIQIAQLVQDGKLMFQIGKLDEAEAKLNEALKHDPNNQAALYYLTIVKQSRARQQVDTLNLNNNGAHNLPSPNAYARNNVIYTSRQRQKVYKKLNDIVFDRISFPNLPLSEVIANLTEQAARRDPEKEGINFIISKAKPSVAGAVPAPPAFDPTTGAPIQPEEIDLSTVQINLDPGLKNVRLMDVLDAIVMTANHPIKYSLLDYGVEFSLKGPETPELFTRTFKVDPNTFYMGLQNVGAISFGTTSGNRGAAGSGSTTIPHVNVSGTGGDGGAAGNRGLRYVTSPDSATDTRTTIQSALVKLFEDSGVKLSSPKNIFFNDRQGTLTVHATADDLDKIETAVTQLNTAPPEVTIKARFVELLPGSDWPKTLDWYADAIATNNGAAFIAPLTKFQFQSALKELGDRKGADLLNEGQVTTLSGRQAQFQMVDVDANDPKATPFGTTLDVVANVGADNSTIQLTLIPTVTERVQDHSTRTIGGLPITATPPPQARVLQLTTNCVVRDGQTLVICGLPCITDNTPSSVNTNKLVFITSTLIDPAGNRIHSDDYYDAPFPGGGFGGGGSRSGGQ
jgi:beta-lactamase regulating signal transducer with metallopeptidase domain